MKKLSIIVPVFNVENYLRRCIDSLISLDNDNVEIIIVDDGSTDTSGAICNEYSNRANIRVIHKENGGLSDARNEGLNCASGEYIWFVDSDDYVLNVFDRILNVITNFKPDIIVMNYVMHNGDKTYNKMHTVLSEEQLYAGEEFLTMVLENKEYYVPVWTNIFSKKYLDCNGFRFRKGIYHEDEQLTPYLFLAAKKICYLDECAYRYIIRENSIANSNKWEKNIKDAFTVFMENAIYFKGNIASEKLMKLLLNDIVEKMIYYLSRYNVPDKQAEKYIDKQFLLECASGPKNKLRVIMFLYSRRLYDLIFRINERMKISK